jgi:hypothetical protein
MATADTVFGVRSPALVSEVPISCPRSRVGVRASELLLRIAGSAVAWIPGVRRRPRLRVSDLVASDTLWGLQTRYLVSAVPGWCPRSRVGVRGSELLLRIAGSAVAWIRGLWRRPRLRVVGSGGFGHLVGTADKVFGVRGPGLVSEVPSGAADRRFCGCVDPRPMARPRLRVAGSGGLGHLVGTADRVFGVRSPALVSEVPISCPRFRVWCPGLVSGVPSCSRGPRIRRSSGCGGGGGVRSTG